MSLCLDLLKLHWSIHWNFNIKIVSRRV